MRLVSRPGECAITWIRIEWTVAGACTQEAAAEAYSEAEADVAAAGHYVAVMASAISSTQVLALLEFNLGRSFSLSEAAACSICSAATFALAKSPPALTWTDG